MWRIAHMNNGDLHRGGTLLPLYYHHPSGTFKSEGYTTWTNREKLQTFGRVDSERNWESFGYPMSIYDDDEKEQTNG